MWTKQEEETLRYLRKQGKEYNEIDDALGKSHGCSWAKAKRLGMVKTQPQRWTAREEYEFKRNKARGLTNRVIAKKMGFSIDFIKKKSAAITKELNGDYSEYGSPNEY